jgi:hypothetical protein
MKKNSIGNRPMSDQEELGKEFNISENDFLDILNSIYSIEIAAKNLAKHNKRHDLPIAELAKKLIITKAQIQILNNLVIELKNLAEKYKP